MQKERSDSVARERRRRKTRVTLIPDNLFLDSTTIQFLSLDFSETSLKPKVPYN